MTKNRSRLVFYVPTTELSDEYFILATAFYEISNDIGALICLNREALAFTERTARLPFLIINLRTDMKRDPMTNAMVSDDLMQEFLTAATANQGSVREQYLLRETFYSLLRLTRSEQLMDIRNSVNRLVPASLRTSTHRKSRGKCASSHAFSTQYPLAFGKQE